tara:strand:- start:1235 stop:1534 length:300 start_codon:yes stop_codon:yes gene_type:complete
MADTNSPIPVNSTWTDLTTASGIPEGTAATVQNLGSPQDLLELWTSPTIPDESEKGIFVTQFVQAKVSADETKMWGRYSVRHGKIVAGKTLLVQVQESV